MCVVVRRYKDILIIIITFPFSTCISSFFGSIIPFSLFIKNNIFFSFLLSNGYATCAYSHMTNPLERPIHFRPDSNRLTKWIEPNRFQTALAQCAFSVNATQCALNRVDCALSVQCEHALRM